MKLTRDNVFEKICEHQAKLRELGVVKLQLFGSTVRNEATEASDLDFLVQLQKNTFDMYMSVKFYLEDLFGCSVDLVLPNTIKPRLRSTILEEAVNAPGF